MTFLQPWLLLALPLVALPVIIHLINQQRFQSVEWAAMRFLLSAKALSRGYTRLRQFLILLLRMLAVAAAILAVSRPLSRGWLAAAGGDRSAAAIVLLDRSPSMSQVPSAGRESKLTTAKRQVATALETLGLNRVVLIDSVSYQPLELSSTRAIEQVPASEPSAAAADLPRLLQAACEQLTATKSAASTIWICSDQRANDWKATDSAWSSIRATLAKLPQTVRVTLLGYTEPAPDNLSVRVGAATLEPRGQGWELRLDISIRRTSESGPSRVPVQIELGPARSTVDIELTGIETVLAGHAIPIEAAALVAGDDAESDQDPTQAHGWGRVSIPADTNPADNDFYVAFGTPPVRRTLVVAEESQAGAESRRTLSLIAGIPPDKILRAAVETVTAEALAAMPLDDVSLLLWQAPLPEAAAADSVSRFVARGGQVIFLPPESPISTTSTTAFDGISWQSWSEHSPPLRPNSWRADEGLLAATFTGTALPVGELEIRRTCGISGEGTPLAVLPDGSPLLVRAASERGGVYFLATTPAFRDSDLAANGVVLYALVQRAVDAGIAAVGNARQVDAGERALGGEVAHAVGQEQWRQIAGPQSASTEPGFHPGIYASHGRLVAVNRPAAEDTAAIVADREVEQLFQGLSFTRFEQKTGGLGNIVEEVWRLFLIAMLLALIAEGLLCLPRRIDRVSRDGSQSMLKKFTPGSGQRAREAVA